MKMTFIQFNANPHIGVKNPHRNSFKRKTFFGDHRSLTGAQPRRFQFKSKCCFRCGNTHDESANCSAMNAKCKHCGKIGHYARVCMQQHLLKVHEIVSSPEYQGQDIHLEDDNFLDSNYDTYTYEEEGVSDTEPINVFLGTLTSTKNGQNQEIALLNSIPDKIHATVRINNIHDMSLKVDTGADTSVITTTDLQHFPFPITILQCSKILKGYGGSMIDNIGAAILKISFKGKSINAKFNIVEAPGSPSMLWCQQSQELGIITANVDEINTNLSMGNRPKDTPETETGAQHGPLSKSTVLEEYADCCPSQSFTPHAPFQYTYSPCTRRNLTRWLQTMWLLQWLNQRTGRTPLYATSKKPLTEESQTLPQP